MTGRMLTRALAAETSKALTLPGTIVAVVIGLLVPPGITALNATSLEAAGYPPDPDLALYAVQVGVLGAIVLGVTFAGSEYAAAAGGGRQTTATFLAMPRRGMVLGVKALVVAVGTGGMSAVSLAVSHAAARAVAGPLESEALLARSGGAVLYCVLSALMAFAVTTIVRNGLVPLVLLAANAVVVPVSLLLSRLTPEAKYLPDLAGMTMFAMPMDVEDTLDPVTGGLVMAGWTVALLVAAGVVLMRRSA